MKKVNSASILLMTVIIFYAASCCPKPDTVAGIWESTEISNPDALFKKTLPDTKPGTIILTVTDTGSFTWKNKTDKNTITGTLSRKENTMILSTEGVKPVSVKIRLKKNTMTLETDDGFTFRFKRK